MRKLILSAITAAGLMASVGRRPWRPAAASR